MQYCSAGLVSNLLEEKRILSDILSRLITDDYVRKNDIFNRFNLFDIQTYTAEIISASNGKDRLEQTVNWMQINDLRIKVVDFSASVDGLFNEVVSLLEKNCPENFLNMDKKQLLSLMDSFIINCKQLLNLIERKYEKMLQVNTK